MRERAGTGSEVAPMANGTILAVDDEGLTLRIIKDTLEDSGFEVVTATNGREALDILQADPQRFDAVVIDRMMPEMNGMSVLDAIRNNDDTVNIPVIFQTAANRSEEMREGIEAGAFYYITKPYNESTLAAIVRSGVDRYKQNRQFASYINDSSVMFDGAHSLVKGEFHFSSLEEARTVVWLISQHAEEPVNVNLALQELIANAIEHGNLGIGGAEKERLIRDNRWDAEIARRMELPENQGKVVVVRFDATDEFVGVAVEDQGAGFSWHRYLADEVNLENRVQGRGIVVARSLAFSDLRYENGGSRAVMSFARG